MGTFYQVVVQGMKRKKMVVDLCNTDEQLMKMTVLQLKENIAKRLPETAGVEALQLIFAEKVLDENNQLLSHFGIKHLSFIQMVIQRPAGGACLHCGDGHHGEMGDKKLSMELPSLLEFEKIYKVVVNGMKGEKMVVNLCNKNEQFKKMTVLQLKKKIAARLPGTAGVEDVRLIFTDKLLHGNNQLLSHFGIQHMSVIQMVLRVPGGGPCPLCGDGCHGEIGDKGGKNQTMELPSLLEMEKKYRVVVNGTRGKKIVVNLCNTDEQFKKMTVLQLKENIAERLPWTAGEKVLRLIFAEKVLDGNDQLLSHFGIEHMSVIQMVVRVPGGLMA